MLHLFGHIINIAIKPIFYVVIAIGQIFYMLVVLCPCFTCTAKLGAIRKIVGLTLCAALTPLAQIILAIRALLGICFPSIYYRPSKLLPFYNCVEELHHKKDLNDEEKNYLLNDYLGKLENHALLMAFTFGSDYLELTANCVEKMGVKFQAMEKTHENQQRQIAILRELADSAEQCIPRQYLEIKRHLQDLDLPAVEKRLEIYFRKALMNFVYLFANHRGEANEINCFLNSFGKDLGLDTQHADLDMFADVISSTDDLVNFLKFCTKTNLIKNFKNFLNSPENKGWRTYLLNQLGSDPTLDVKAKNCGEQYMSELGVDTPSYIADTFLQKKSDFTLSFNDVGVEYLLKGKIEMMANFANKASYRDAWLQS